MKQFTHFVLLTIGRICLPFSFLIACLISPIVMFSNIRNLVFVAKAMWDDPI